MPQADDHFGHATSFGGVLKQRYFRAGEPAVCRPGRKTGIRFQMKIERRRRGTNEFPGAAPLALYFSALPIPSLRPGLFVTGTSA